MILFRFCCSLLLVWFLALGVAAQAEDHEYVEPAPGMIPEGAELLSPAPAPTTEFEAAFRNLSSLQAMLEFFFMEAGVYPGSLDDLNTAYNSKLPQGSKAVPIPKDPATGKNFVYIPGANRKGYLLRFPEPQKYGLGMNIELTPVSWGWLALRAERKRFEELAKLSKYHMETLATQVEMFAKDNKGEFPETLDLLYPKYIKRHPQDPITGKNYIYKTLADGYLVASPNPERYGLRLFQYSSSQGIIVEALAGGATSE